MTGPPLDHGTAEIIWYLMVIGGILFALDVFGRLRQGWMDFFERRQYLRDRAARYERNEGVRQPLPDQGPLGRFADWWLSGHERRRKF